jgi:hypothetical protein
MYLPWYFLSFCYQTPNVISPFFAARSEIVIPIRPNLKINHPVEVITVATWTARRAIINHLEKVVVFLIAFKHNLVP